MPSRNIIRNNAAESYYHVYSRGINKSAVFSTDEDKDYFLYLIARHLSVEPVVNSKGYTYPHYRNKVELLSYCLMDNHIHLLIYQNELGALADFMQSVMSAYTAYYNRQHNRRGPLFESRYKSSQINKDDYLIHISRYIHLNPRSWKRYKYSSLRYIQKSAEPEWLQTSKVLDLHESRSDYLAFVEDYEANKQMKSELKYKMANL